MLFVSQTNKCPWVCTCDQMVDLTGNQGGKAVTIKVASLQRKETFECKNVYITLSSATRVLLYVTPVFGPMEKLYVKAKTKRTTSAEKE